MDVPFPDRYHLAKTFVQDRFGDLEQSKEVPTAEKLALYALSMQADSGPCNKGAPYMWNVTERYKHGAWSQLGKMCAPEAMVKYVDILERLVGRDWVAKASPKLPSVSQVPPSATSMPQPDASSPPKRRPSEASSEIIGNLSAEVSAENVDALRKEVVRLRRLLARHGISHDVAPTPQSASQNSSFCARSPEASRIPHHRWELPPHISSPSPKPAPSTPPPAQELSRDAPPPSHQPPSAHHSKSVAEAAIPLLGPLPLPPATLRPSHTKLSVKAALSDAASTVPIPLHPSPTSVDQLDDQMPASRETSQHQDEETAPTSQLPSSNNAPKSDTVRHPHSKLPRPSLELPSSPTADDRGADNMGWLEWMGLR